MKGFTNYVIGTSIAVLTFAVAFGAGRMVFKTTRSSVQEPVNMAQSLEIARRLLDSGQAVDWNWSQVYPELLRVPDQDFAYRIDERSPQTQTFTVNLIREPYGTEVAFYSSLYVRRQRTADSSAPELEKQVITGTYIVGWKNGEIRTFDVRDVRLKPVERNSSQILVPVFPGMACYSTNLGKIRGT